MDTIMAVTKYSKQPTKLSTNGITGKDRQVQCIAIKDDNQLFILQ